MDNTRIIDNITAITDIYDRWNQSDNDYPVERVQLSDAVYSDNEFGHIELFMSKLVKDRFIKCSFERSSFVDVIFDGCDFSNSNLSDAYFQRCEFINCKFVGCNMVNSSLKNCSIHDSIYMYVNMSESLFEDVLMQRSDFSDAVLSDIKHKRWKITECRLIRTSFFRTKLKGMNLSDNELIDFVISDSLSEIKGAKISPIQAMEVARLVGAVVI